MPFVFQQTKPVVHKLLGARMYDSRAKRPKLKATDRRPTVDVTEPLDAESTGDDCIKPPQTIDEIRRLQNQRLQNADAILKPYIGKRTAVVMQDKAVKETSRTSEDCVSDAATSTSCSCNIPTSDSTTNCDTAKVNVQYHLSGRRSKVKSKGAKNETAAAAHSVDTNCLPKEKLAQYLHAVG